MELLKKILKSLIIGTITGITIAFITHNFVPDLIDRLEHQSYYMRYYWKYMELNKNKNTGEEQEDETGIFIIDIDDRSQHKMGNYWHWNRSYHAQMIRSLDQHFPAAVAFDILFYDPEDSLNKERTAYLLNKSKERYPDIVFSDEVEQSILNTIDYDKQLIDATEESGKVFHSVRMSGREDYPAHTFSQVQHRTTLSWHDSLNPESCLHFAPRIRTVVPSRKNIIDGTFPALANKAHGIGHINVAPNDDGVIREIPLLYGLGEHEPVYIPLSLRVAATLFGTPNEEIRFQPGEYIDIGKPFKIFKGVDNRITFSYPHITVSQIKAILERSHDILALAPGKNITITSLLKIGRDEDGDEFISSHFGDFPKPIVNALSSFPLNKVLMIEADDMLEIGSEITIRRDSDIEWVVTAPFGDEEWYLTKDDITMITKLDFNEFEYVQPNETKLVFHTFTVRNMNGTLISSIPVLRGKTLKELCQTPWSEIEELAAGTRRDFGQTVKIPLTQDNKHIVTYFGKKKNLFKYCSYYDIMSNRIHGDLEGKIYLVGSSVAAMFDIVSVPMDNVYPGVEVHASLIHSFLTNTFVTRLQGWQDFLILLLVGIIVGILAYMLRPLYSIILSFIFIFLYFFIAMTAFGTHFLWIEIARPILTIILTYTAVMAYRYITEEKDRKFLQSTFKQYLSPELIDIMYQKKQVPQLGGEEGVRTAYFTDIQSFSTFSEKLGSPTRLVELLNEYLTVMTDELLLHYGTLDKYEGDAIIAFFGAPMPMENHAQQACATALGMQRRLAELRAKWRSDGDKWPEIVHNMRMRIGINTGAITTGNMGSAVRMNYTMMGDAVNLAARLESAAKQYGVYTMISHYTFDIIKNEFETRQLDKITVVGKSEPVVVYELLGEKGKLDNSIVKLTQIYRQGLDYFYAQAWDKAIETMLESEKLEPNKEFTSGGMSPSRKIITYCEYFQKTPPEPHWDGVIKLTSK